MFPSCVRSCYLLLLVEVFSVTTVAGRYASGISSVHLLMCPRTARREILVGRRVSRAMRHGAFLCELLAEKPHTAVLLSPHLFFLLSPFIFYFFSPATSSPVCQSCLSKNRMLAVLLRSFVACFFYFIVAKFRMFFCFSHLITDHRQRRAPPIICVARRKIARGLTHSIVLQFFVAITSSPATSSPTVSCLPWTRRQPSPSPS